MKIYTKSGDKGRTSLASGERISKADLRVCAYGDMDELISHLGVLRSEIAQQESISFIRVVQQDLMKASAFVASTKDLNNLASLNEEDVTKIESEIDKLSTQLPPQEAFILPAAPRVASECHVARTVCRRAERTLISLDDQRESIELILKYLNRLSDYLFTLSRYQVVMSGGQEDFWLP